MDMEKRPDFDESLIQGDASQRQGADDWLIAIGLQDVDHLKNSPCLYETARQHIEGKLELDVAQKRISDYYQTEEGRRLAAEHTDEADVVAIRIVSRLSENAFSFISAVYANLHRRLFSGLFPHAGQYRTVNFSKKEWVLDGESVLYAPAGLPRETLEYDFSEEPKFSYGGLSSADAVKHICKFRLSSGSGSLNFAQGISATTICLERFFENLIINGKNELKNRFCHILWKEGAEFQGANPKCRNFTLEEMAVLEYLEKTPGATQKMVAAHIGKSERTVKSLTKALQEKGLLFR